MDKGPDPTFVVRPCSPEDARAVADVHWEAVHSQAGADYPPELLDEWSPPVTDERVAHSVRAAATSRERKFAAEVRGEIVGFGGLDRDTAEVTAVYVRPDATRKGVGTALVRAIEALAKQEGIPKVWLDSSLGAVSFYAARGYESIGPGEHVLRSGRKMACVRMEKRLRR